MTFVVKTRIEYQTEWSLPQFRVEADSFVEILAKCVQEGDEVTASNGLHDFDSIEDMRLNSELLAGNPQVTIGCTEIRLDGTIFKGVSFLSYKSNADISRTRTIAEKLSGLLTPHRTYVRTPFFRWPASILLMFGLMFLFSKWDDLPGWLYFLFAFSFFQGALWIQEKLLPSDHVYYSPVETFWDRNKDKVYVGIIMFVVGAILSFAVNDYLPGLIDSKP